MNVQITITEPTLDVIELITRTAIVEKSPDPILDRPMQGNFTLQDTLAEVARHYLHKALAENNGNMTRAAQQLGFPSAQTMRNWCLKYDVK